jgi:hypothetical protein
MKDVNKMTKRQLERAAWMGKFEALVCRANKKHCGKIDWNEAAYFYNTGRSEKSAATIYVTARTNSK